MSSIADSITAADGGSAPAWYAAPTRRKFAGMVSPNNACAAAAASSGRTVFTLEAMRVTRSPTSGGVIDGSRTWAPVGTALVATTATVWSGEA